MNRAPGEFARVPGCRAKHTLGDVFGEVTIYHHAHCRRINVIDVPADELVEGRFRSVFDVFAEKVLIRFIDHRLKYAGVRKTGQYPQGVFSRKNWVPEVRLLVRPNESPAQKTGPE